MVSISTKNRRAASAGRTAAQLGQGYSTISAAEAARPCMADDHCAGTVVPNAPVRICGAHLRELYEFASDLITENWDAAIREYVSELHETFRPPKAVKQPRQGTVYFIRFGDRVKVGFSTDPARRIKALPHEEVIGIVPGTRANEQALHDLLAEFHVVGEWFRAEPELLAVLGRIVSAQKAS